MSDTITEPKDQGDIIPKNSQNNVREAYSDQADINYDNGNKEPMNQTYIDQENIAENSNNEETITVSDQENQIKDHMSNGSMNGPNITGNESRRKRINRMKTVIVIIIILLLLFPTICCIVLGIQVNSLQKQINQMNDPNRYGMLHESITGMSKSYAEGSSVPEFNQNSEEIDNPVLSPENNPESFIAGMDEIMSGDPDIQDQSVNSKDTGKNGVFVTSQPDSQASAELPDSDMVTSQTDDTDSGEDNYIINDFNNNSNIQDENGSTGQITGQPEVSSDSNSDGSSKNNNENGNNTDNTNNETGIVNNNDTLSLETEVNPNSDNDVTADAGTDSGINGNGDPDAAEADPEKEDVDAFGTAGQFIGKTVYLTFDDGPSIYTGKILDILAKYNVKATFFVVGKTDNKSKKMYQRIVNEGHTLGMHSYSHKYDNVYNSAEDFDKDFTKLWNLLYDTTGYKPSIYRFPGGSNNKVNKYGMEDFIQYLNSAGIVYFDWNVVSGDATGVKYSKEQLICNVLSGVTAKKTSIVLMHDSRSKSTTVESLPKLLEKLISGGATILPLDKNVTPIQMIKADSIK